MTPSLRIVTQTPEPGPQGYVLVPAHLREAADELTRETRALSLICSRVATLKLADAPEILASIEAVAKRARIAIERSR